MTFGNFAIKYNFDYSAVIKVSKSDPFWDTSTVVVGRNNSALCPVEALLKYLYYRGGRPGPPFHFSRWVSSHQGFY